MASVQPASLGALVVALEAKRRARPSHPLRRFCYRLATSPWFDRVSVVVVLTNTVVLGLVDYSSPWATGPNMLLPANVFIERVNNISLVLFVVEALIKAFAFGVFKYLGDHWNKLDLIVIISGIVAWASGGRSAVGQLRILRVLRPLRTLRAFPGLRILVNGVLASLPPLLNAGMLLGFSYLTLAILGMELWQDKYHGRCRLTPYPVRLNFDPLHAPTSVASGVYPNASYVAAVTLDPSAYKCNNLSNSDVWRAPTPCFWPLDPTDTLGLYCGSRTCPTPNTTCGSNYDRLGNPRFLNFFSDGALVFDLMGEPDFTANLNFGLTSFDNIWSALVIVLQIVTASGWMVLTQNTQDAYSWVVAGVYFNAFLFIGMCFLLQLFMAVLYTEFEKAKTNQERQLESHTVIARPTKYIHPKCLVACKMACF
ncbi:hypothetical protein SPRG_06780 [Saprolegnia parasitica CBS 223.65]|uniref:Ion transport domain-containing protein n=1 Tax=Saprolegnia parasitica (strain CBS 223.65) TaxID=695850 RepID=A0A067CAI0_SAPPC|nr:hypothetical protein SPRG_06780 [Saprolegnia parasitica CBS 223.65]KDO27513.1 hypothetical protein SPRG_06780 [Saprolegnia parasitica CBS 223.65]|eukprot:XP_012201640.1 hypothetical protein SPRG_06780 [Saprolegnia parasitica CBS 223.65]